MKLRRGNIHFATRGWTLALLFALLLASRIRSDAPLRWEMLSLIAAALLLRLWAGAHLGRHGNGVEPEAPALATDGPYAFSRNPLYLSNIAAGAGLILFANSLSPAGAFIMLAALFIHHIALVRAEEARLRVLLGGEYEAYLVATPRWFSIRPPEKTSPDKKNAAPSATLREAWNRQSGNFLYAPAAVALLWAAARWL